MIPLEEIKKATPIEVAFFFFSQKTLTSFHPYRRPYRPVALLELLLLRLQ